MTGIYAAAVLDDTRHYVYAMLCQDGDGPGYVKFGRSRRIRQRLTELRTACPIPARFFAIAEVTNYHKSLIVEKALHERFADRKITGEWYRFDFYSGDDKREFNDGSNYVFGYHLKTNPGWTKISVKALDADAKERRKVFLESMHRRKIQDRADYKRRQSKSWSELGAYGR